MRTRLPALLQPPIGFAHRGARAHADENTIGAFDLARRLGATGLESDAWLTRDGEVVLDHDGVVGRWPNRRSIRSVDRAALGGKAVRKQVTIWFGDKASGRKIDVLIYQPPGAPGASGKWPLFLGYNYYGNACVTVDPGVPISTAWMRANPDAKVVDHRATEGTRGAHASRWDLETVLARGYATATAYYGDVCPDRSGAEPEALGGLLGGRVNADRAPGEWAASTPASTSLLPR